MSGSAFIAYKYRNLPRSLNERSRHLLDFWNSIESGLANSEEPTRRHHALMKLLLAEEDSSLKRLWQIVVDHELYYANPSSLNDPFECDLIGPYRQFLQDIVDTPGAAEKLEISTERMDDIRRSLDLEPEELQEAMSPEMPKVREDLRKKYDKLLGVLSLSKNPAQPLLWAHYGANHFGVAVGIRVHRQSEEDCSPQVFDVTYPEQAGPGIVTAFRDSIEPHDAVKIAIQALCRKTSDWHYEGEVRAFRDLDEGGPVESFPGEQLVELVFGVRTNPEVRDLIISWFPLEDPQRPKMRQVFNPDFGKLDIRDISEHE